MKNKVIRKDYDKLEEDYIDANETLEYYGVLKKKGVIKIDTKRFLKFFEAEMPAKYDFSRNTVYFYPLKKKYTDYAMSYFLHAIGESRDAWYEDKEITHRLIKEFIETEREKKAPSCFDSLMQGYIDYDEYQANEMMNTAMHQAVIDAEIDKQAYMLLMKLYSNTINNMASHLENAMLASMRSNGYNYDKCGRRDIYKFMDGKIKKSESKISILPHFKDYDMFYSIWNFLKHNSDSTYGKLKKYYPDLLKIKGKTKGFNLDFPSGEMAIHYLNIDDKFINSLFSNLVEFYYEFCELCYLEPKYHALWDYEEFFINIAKRKCDEVRESYEWPCGDFY